MATTPARRHRERRERHGRQRRTPVDPLRRPLDGHRTRDREDFSRLVATALTTLPAEIREALGALDVLVQDVPDLAASATEVPLSTRDTRGPKTHLLVHRRPLEARAVDRGDLVDLVAAAVVEQLAAHHGWGEQDLRDRGWDADLPDD